MRIVIVTIAVVLVIGTFNGPALYADLVWNGGYHEFSEGYEWEVWLLNDATGDITGGEIGQLLCYDTSEVFVYEPSEIDLIKPFESATVNIYDGTITTVLAEDSSNTSIYSASLAEIGARGLSIVNLYTASYEIDLSGGTFGNGLLTGTWLYGGSFSIDLVAEETINHLNFVPEPFTMSLFVIGSLMLRAIRKKRK